MVDVGSFVSSITSISWGNVVINIIFGTVVMLLLAGIITWGFIWFKNKKLYIYPVSLIVQKDNASHKRRDDLRGGLVKQKNGVTDFVVKIPKTYKKVRIGYVPDFSLADASDRIVFLKSGDGIIWQQCAEKLVTEKEIEIVVDEGEGENTKEVKKKVNVSLLIEPIPTDVKHVTINSIQAAESVLEGNKLKAAAIIVGGFVLMVIVQIIFLFLTSK